MIVPEAVVVYRASPCGEVAGVGGSRGRGRECPPRKRPGRVGPGVLLKVVTYASNKRGFQNPRIRATDGGGRAVDTMIGYRSTLTRQPFSARHRHMSRLFFSTILRSRGNIVVRINVIKYLTAPGYKCASPLSWFTRYDLGAANRTFINTKTSQSSS